MQLIERMLNNFNRLGSGSYSAVFDTNDGNVLKVPFRQYDGPSSQQCGTLRERMFITRCLYESTMWLNRQMGDIITPIRLGPGGTLRQKKLHGTDCYDLPRGQKLYDLLGRIEKMIDDAADLVASAPSSLSLGSIDGARCNFMVNSDYEILGWYDPFVPRENPFAPWYNK